MSSPWAGRRPTTRPWEPTMWTTTPVSAVAFGALRGQQRGLAKLGRVSRLRPLREHPAGGPAGAVAAGAGVHAAGLPVGGPRGPQRPEGDLPGEGAAAPPGPGGVPAAQRRLEGQVHVPDQPWVPEAGGAEG